MEWFGSSSCLLLMHSSLSQLMHHGTGAVTSESPQVSCKQHGRIGLTTSVLCLQAFATAACNASSRGHSRLDHCEVVSELRTSACRCWSVQQLRMLLLGKAIDYMRLAESSTPK